MTIRSTSLSDAQTFKLLFHDLMLEYRTIMPAIIKSINQNDDGVWSIDAQPAIGLLVSEDQSTKITQEPLPIIKNCPLVLPYAPSSGMALTLPLKAGDDCLLLIADRSIDAWQANGGLQYPVERTLPRTGHLTDAVCLPCAITAKTAIKNYNLDSIEFRNADRSNYISLSNTDIQVTFGSNSSVLNSTQIEHKVGGATLTLTNSSLVSSVPIEAPSYSGTSGGIANFNSGIDMNNSGIDNATTVTVNGVELGVHTHIAPNGGGVTTGPQ